MLALIARIPMGLGWALVTFGGWLVGIAVNRATGLAMSFGTRLNDTSVWHEPIRVVLDNAGSPSFYMVSGGSKLHAVIEWALIAAMFLPGMAAIGAVVGTGQWLVLTRRGPVRPAWIAATVLGFGLAEGLYIISWFVPILPIAIVLNLLGGAILGGLQSLAWPRSSRNTRYWMWALALIYLLGVAIAALLPFPDQPLVGELMTQSGFEAIYRVFQAEVDDFYLRLAVLRGLVISVLSGFALHRMLSRPRAIPSTSPLPVISPVV
jgi:hypothetical protein